MNFELYKQSQINIILMIDDKYEINLECLEDIQKSLNHFVLSSKYINSYILF
jgi:hypothetical protein